MIKNGISEENLTKLFTHAQIGPKEQDMVRNLCFLGVNCIADVSIKLSQNALLFRISLISIPLLWFRVIAKNPMRFHEKSASPNTPIKCPDGPLWPRTLWKIALKTNWIKDIFHFWLDVHRMLHIHRHRLGKFIRSHSLY